jgi:hypothetical protein
VIFLEAEKLDDSIDDEQDDDCFDEDIYLTNRDNILPSEQFQRQTNFHFMFENIEFFSTEIRKKV